MGLKLTDDARPKSHGTVANPIPLANNLTSQDASSALLTLSGVGYAVADRQGLSRQSGENLSNQKTLLSNINLTVMPNELMSIIGPNGVAIDVNEGDLGLIGLYETYRRAVQKLAMCHKNLLCLPFCLCGSKIYCLKSNPVALPMNKRFCLSNYQ